MIWLTHLLGHAFVGHAEAATMGEPVLGPETGVVRAAVRGHTGVVGVEDADCAPRGECKGVWQSRGAVVQVGVAPLRGLALSAEWGRQRTVMDEARYQGEGAFGALGLQGALPLGATGAWVAAAARLEGGKSVGDDLQDGGREQAAWTTGLASLALAWRETTGGVQVWAGGQAAPLWRHDILPLGDQGASAVVLPLDTVLPGSLLAGLVLRSDPLGTGFQRSARLAVGVEGRVGQDNGVSAWIEVAY